MPIDPKTWSLLLGVLSAVITSSNGVKCFACTSSLPQEPNDYAKNLAKKVVSDYYVLPEVSVTCNNPTEPDFINTLKVDCDREDVCVRITAAVEGLTFTIRGCKKSVFKRSPDPDMKCLPNQSPSMCECTKDLCNGVARQARISNIAGCFFSALILLLSVRVFWR